MSSGKWRPFCLGLNQLKKYIGQGIAGRPIKAYRGDMILIHYPSQHRTRYWLVAWRQCAITLTVVEGVGVTHLCG